MSSSIVQGRLRRPAASASFEHFVLSAALSSDVVMAFICCSRINNTDPPIGLSNVSSATSGFPDKQTFSVSVGMSQRCQQETHAVQQF